MSWDAIVVGAGPVGSTVAEAVAREGYEVLILEEHSKVGHPWHCTGKISINASKELNLPDIGTLHKVRGAIFHSPNMSSISVERKEFQANIIDRALLDKRLSEKAVDAGAALLTNARVVDASTDSSNVKVRFRHDGETHLLNTKIVIGADGAVSSIARNSKLYSKNRSSLRVVIQREMINLHNLRPGFVEVYMGKKFSPGFFAWIVPTGERRAKIGLGTVVSQSKDLLNYLEYFLTSHPISSNKLKGGVCESQTAHIIPIGGTLRQTISDGVLIVGDSAGQVKSTTGGGLYYGIVSAKIAGQVVSKTLATAHDILRKEVLMEYQNRWQKRLGKEIEMGVKIRQVLDSLTDEDLNYLFNISRKDQALIGLIEAEGDIDWQSRLSGKVLARLTRALVKRPQLLRKLVKLLI